MNTKLLFYSSLRTIQTHPFRSLLTIIGIMIGIAAIIVTFSIGSGTEKRIRKQILSFGKDAIYIIPGNIIERGRVTSSLAEPITLKEKDLFAITKQIPTAYASRGHDTLQIIEYKKNAIREKIYGTDENMLHINNYKIMLGEFFTKHHLQHRSNVIVLGHEIRHKLFGDANPIGKTVRVGKHPFTVIGVLNEIKHYWGVQNPNLRSYIPYTASKKYFLGKNEAEDDLGFIAFRPFETINSKKIVRLVKRILRLMHNTAPGEPDDYTIFDQASIGKTAQEASALIKLFGLLAASISLIVGGIGVMNIMLVGVKERTNEIGIRLALGATQWNIQLQFLIESVVLCTIGGILGVIIGIMFQYLITSTAHLTGSIEFIPIFISFLMTVLTGIFFGYYPARSASLLNPVEALREK